MDTMLSAIRFLYPDIERIMHDDIHLPKLLSSTVDHYNFKEIVDELEKHVQFLVDGN